MTLYPCRCSRRKCQARRTLPKHPDDYKRPPKCHFCGGRKWRIDKWRKRNEHGVACHCQGAHYPHRPGSIVCFDHPEYHLYPHERAELASLRAFDKVRA